jgi:hypothetical protein
MSHPQRSPPPRVCARIPESWHGRRQTLSKTCFSAFCTLKLTMFSKGDLAKSKPSFCFLRSVCLSLQAKHIYTPRCPTYIGPTCVEPPFEEAGILSRKKTLCLLYCLPPSLGLGEKEGAQGAGKVRWLFSWPWRRKRTRKGDWLYGSRRNGG